MADEMKDYQENVADEKPTTENEEEKKEEVVENIEEVITESENTESENKDEEKKEPDEIVPEVTEEPEEKKAPVIQLYLDPEEEKKTSEKLKEEEQAEIKAINERMQQKEMNAAVAEPKKKGSNKLFLILLSLFTILGSVGGSYLVSKAVGKAQERVVVYESVDTTPATVITNDLSSIVEKIDDTVVEVYTERVQHSVFYGEYVTSGAGSGVIYSEDGYIVTNNHVIKGASNIMVKLHDGTQYQAVLVATDADTDLAVLKIDATGLTPAILANGDNLKVGEQVIAIGNPLGTLGGTVTTGIVSALSREITVENQKMTLLQTNAAINPGNSGGGLFNTSGELVAVVNAKSSGSDVEGIGFAIPVNIVKQVVEDLMLNGYVKGRPALGISCVSIENRQYMYYYGVSTYGVYVKEAIGQNAKTAGLQEGDLIVGIDNYDVISYTTMKEALENYNVGDVVKLKIIRGTEEITLNLALDEKKVSQ